MIGWWGVRGEGEVWRALIALALEGWIVFAEAGDYCRWRVRDFAGHPCAVLAEEGALDLVGLGEEAGDLGPVFPRAGDERVSDFACECGKAVACPAFHECADDGFELICERDGGDGEEEEDVEEKPPEDLEPQGKGAPAAGLCGTALLFRWGRVSLHPVESGNNQRCEWFG